MPVGYLTQLESSALAAWRDKSKKTLYRTDPEAWYSDVLGGRWWSIQREIAWSFVNNEFTLVKSCNGVGKTKLVADLMSWFISVHPPEDTIAVLSAPVREQIDINMFGYFRENYRQAIEMGQPLPGKITKWPKWETDVPYPIDLAIPKRPADQNLISSFQGIHRAHVAVGLDEAGGLPEDLYTAANAVTTNDHARIIGIGNPDQLHTAFHERFTDRDKFDFWNVFTIGANDTPNFTGEVIFPDDPEKDRFVKSKLVKVGWAAMMRKSASPGVIAAKVDGEFPSETDTNFFAQSTMNKAFDNRIEPNTYGRIWIGADLSYQGEDQSAMYVNRDGQIRQLDVWNRDTGTEAIESARRIHNAAVEIGAQEVRVDKAGTGSGVFSNLITLEEFADRPYTVIGINGSNSTPNTNRWLNARAWHYDQFRDGMNNGTIDLDITDKELKTELEVQTFEMTNQQKLKITPKSEMAKKGIRSPDHLDAAIYSMVDCTWLTDGFAAGKLPGDSVMVDPSELWALDFHVV